MVTWLIQSFLELLLIYKESNLYYIHILLMFVLMVIMCYFTKLEHELMERQKNPPQSNYSQKIDYVDYKQYVKTNTSKQLAKLQKTQQFQRFLQQSKNPNSRYCQTNRNYEDVQQIVFSDEEQEQKEKQRTNSNLYHNKNF